MYPAYIGVQEHHLDINNDDECVITEKRDESGYSSIVLRYRSDWTVCKILRSFKIFSNVRNTVGGRNVDIGQCIVAASSTVVLAMYDMTDPYDYTEISYSKISKAWNFCRTA